MYIMCWNKDVSLNTFLFSFSVLLLLIYNNTYTRYKIPALHNPAIYLLVFFVINIQFVEYFIWKNISKKSITKFFSFIGILFLFLQPFTALFILKDISLRWNLLFVYCAITIPLLLYNFWKNDIGVEVSKLGNLQWNWFGTGIPLLLFRISYLFFLFFPLVWEKEWWLFIFAFVPLMWTLYNYINANVNESMWCWSANSFAMLVAFVLLFYLPFKEKMSC